jgi:glycosyltransferase involved in cell wall biosynthesis
LTDRANEAWVPHQPPSRASAAAFADAGRRHARAGEWGLALQRFAEAFEAEPAQWWLAVEALRAGIRMAREAEYARDHPGTTLLFYPDFSINNRYQPNLYAAAAQQGVAVVSLSVLTIDADLCRTVAQTRVIFHQHWLHPVYQRHRHDEPAAMRALTRHLSLIRALKAFHCRVLWTLHNLEDHDANDVQQRLSVRAAVGMQALADEILVHDQAAVAALAAWTRSSVAPKCRILPHPLYDDLLSRGRRWPAELERRPTGALARGRVAIRPHETLLDVDADPQRATHEAEPRWLLMVGRLSPYKGGHELLASLERVAMGPAAKRIHVVIAGRTPDPSIIATASRLQARHPGLISLLPRRLDDDELAALVERAAVLVTPYRKVLTSGTYFLAATFSKPVLAPRIGMFEAKVDHDGDGLLYDGTVEGLAQALEAIASYSSEQLAEMGRRAHARNSGQTIAAISKRFATEVLT